MDTQQDNNVVVTDDCYQVNFTAVTDEGRLLQSHSQYRVDSAAEAIERLHDEADLGHLTLLRADLSGEPAHGVATLFDRMSGECELSPLTGSSVTVIVGTARIVIKRESEGVVVDLYDQAGQECLNTMAATWDECADFAD